jgi:hypothetical protein
MSKKKMSKDKFEDPVGKEYKIPDAFLHSLSEQSPEGFLLFTISNTGEPQVHASFIHQITEMGLRSYATKFLKGINTIEDSGIAEGIYKEGEESSEEEDKDTEE